MPWPQTSTPQWCHYILYYIYDVNLLLLALSLSLDVPLLVTDFSIGVIGCMNLSISKHGEFLLSIIQRAIVIAFSGIIILTSLKKYLVATQ